MAEMLSSGTGSLRTFHLVVSFDAEENWDGLITQCKTNVCTVDTDRMVDHCS